MKKYRLPVSILSLIILSAVLAGCCCDDDDCDCQNGNPLQDDDVADDDSADDDGLADDDTADDDTNLDPGVDWVEIPAGGFEMGCSPGDDLCNPDENPPHEVHISAFEIAATETTQEQYEAVTGKKPSYFTPANGFASCPDCPVENVSWFDAWQYCAWIGGRLPTEAEWEYAARAGTTTRTYCGDDLACLDEIAWYSANADDQTHPVATKEANDFALYDVLGNVWEWVNDWYSTDAYIGSEINDPPGPEPGWFRVLRGGSWIYDTDTQMTVSDRFLHSPEHSYPYIGFRCARE